MNTMTKRTLADLVISICLAPNMVLGVSLNELLNEKKMNDYNLQLYKS